MLGGPDAAAYAAELPGSLLLKDVRIAWGGRARCSQSLRQERHNVLYRHGDDGRIVISLHRAPEASDEVSGEGTRFDPLRPLASVATLDTSSLPDLFDRGLGQELDRAEVVAAGHAPLGEGPSAPSKLPDLQSARTVMTVDARGSLLVPGGLCHPHVHLDKCFLLSRCGIHDGTFEEALKRTGEAKRDFTFEDLVERGRRLIASSLSHGVTAMRAHVEVDPTVSLTCLRAGLHLKDEFASRCTISLVAFAQDPLFPLDDSKRNSIQDLLRQAAIEPGVDAVGSAPYIEPRSSDSDGVKGQVEMQRRNIDLVFDLARRNGKDVDFHLDYDLDAPSPDRPSLIPYVLDRALALPSWTVAAGRRRRITLGHCTKLSVFSDDDLDDLVRRLRALSSRQTAAEDEEANADADADAVHFGRSERYAVRSRATMPALDLVSSSGGAINVSMGVNNVANLFTPQGDADPLALLPMMVAVWQKATPTDCQTLLDMVATNARTAAGCDRLDPDATWGAEALLDATILDGCASVQDAALAPPFGRITIKHGKVVARRSVDSWTT
ncbi:uncharacterized protein PSFLO_01717 [Pseudozyma flocculosa]|uniref:Amidohydrolase-related domain-containing protein n=1 Tax=Pseudozyma flocculosa TaxID=84751 RepID=A0A5C3EXB7_9BASI|nr:uncharacterized protein PSFLO_01717 [Pseudozyma flocculosa]